MTKLFEPTTLAGHALQNRIAMAPLAAPREQFLYTRDAEGCIDHPPLAA